MGSDQTETVLVSIVLYLETNSFCVRKVFPQRTPILAIQSKFYVEELIGE